MSVMAIFNIGTNHVQTEENNTIAQLGKACASANKVINDGVGAGPHPLNAAFGWGMNEICQWSVAAIRTAKPKPTRVVMTGHSRGAIICHMIAHEIFKDRELQNIEIAMILLDPVHQSKEEHPGAEHLDDNPNLIRYHSIVMTDERQTAALGIAKYPYKFPATPSAMARRMHFIPMPGQHGSGSQHLTSPVGKVCFQLIMDFMMRHDVDFNIRPRDPKEMCDLFAEIHVRNPVGAGGRLLFDDPGNAREHVMSNEVRGGTDMRAADVRRAHILNQSLDFLHSPSAYFFNIEHKLCFNTCFPYLHSLITDWAATSFNPFNIDQFAGECLSFHQYPYLGDSKHVRFLLDCLKPCLQPPDFTAASTWVWNHFV